jgi:peptide/nickel transport system permease protein
MVPETATAEMRENVRKSLGLDKPIYVQYINFLSDLAKGDLGTSYLQREKVSTLVLQRMPATLELAFVAMAIAVVLSIPLGIFVASRRNTVWDLLGSTFALIGQATPNFWLGLMLILIFAVHLRILPISGRGTPSHIILPALTLSLSSLGYFTRMMRSSMLEVMGQDYILTARAKGLRESLAVLVQKTKENAANSTPGRRLQFFPGIVLGHMLKNALIPVVTVMGISFGNLLSGAFVIETVFAWPGFGRLGVNALFERDFPVIQGVVLVSSTIFVLTTLIVDILYSILDPRIRIE